jgi:hypothetical protein
MSQEIKGSLVSVPFESNITIPVIWKKEGKDFHTNKVNIQNGTILQTVIDYLINYIEIQKLYKINSFSCGNRDNHSSLEGLMASIIYTDGRYATLDANSYYILIPKLVFFCT